MNGLGGIQVATDFSEGANWALERARLLPLRRGAGLELLHVAPADASEAEVRKRLDPLRSRDFAVSIARGRPSVEIVRSAHHGRFELIVLGRHGDRTFRDLLIGSTAERVIRQGDVSVLVVAKPPEQPYRRPVVAVDFSESSRLALKLALRMTDATAPIVVVHAADEAGRHRADLAGLVDEAARDRGHEIVFETGDPRQVILDLAQKRHADLIALGTQGRTGLPHLLIGSVAEGVLRAAERDVLVARLPTVDFRLA